MRLEDVVLAGAAFVVGWLHPLYALPAPSFPPAQATIIFGGDMMFDRTVRQAIDARGGDYIFSCLDDTLRQADAVVANLEGPITDDPSISVGSKPGDDLNFTFTFATSTATLLARHHVTAVNLGNNHILNFGVDGASSTIRYLRDAGVGYFGDPIEHAVFEDTVHGINIAFVGYNEFGGAASTTRAQIRAERVRGYLPIVYTHWGIEYATTSPQYVRDLAHSFVDAGAMMVIGSHPHVVEDHETYHGVPIYYSLGNLIFDQYWNNDVRHGLLLFVLLNDEGVASVRPIPVELEHDRRTCVVDH